MVVAFRPFYGNLQRMEDQSNAARIDRMQTPREEMNRSRRRLATGYLALQSVAIAAWWTVMMILPSVRSSFAPSGSEDILLAFAPGDALVVALGLYVGIQRGGGRSDIAGWLIAGAMSYATLFTIAIAAWRLAPSAGAMLMTPAAMASCWAATVLSRRGPSSAVSSGSRP
jgi:hypothetical protein